MPWVRFTKAFDWKPTLKVMFAYKAGAVYLVKRACADQAIKEGKAVEIERPEKKRGSR